MASINFINECKNRAYKNRLGKLIVDGITNPITNSDNLQSISIDSGCYVDGNIIGSIYVKCLTSEMTNTSNINLVDKSLYAQIGVKYADLNDEYIKIGKYTVEDSNNEITADMGQITAYDDLANKIDSNYVCGIDYDEGNKTVRDLYIDVCSQLGLTPVTTDFINNNILITSNPFTNGEKNRTVLQTVSKIASSFVDIDNDTNQIDLRWVSQNEEPDYTFLLNDYSSVEGGQVVCGPINSLVIKNSQIDDENVSIKDEESIALYGEHSIVISEDYILYNADLRQQAITSIWNRVHGMKYVDCKLTTYYGKPFLKLGDKIRVYTGETDYFDTYVLKHNFTYDGSFTSVIESPALSEQEIKTKQDISLGEALKNTQYEVNKQDGILTALTTDMQNISTNINDNYYTITETNTLVQTASDGLVNTFSKTGGNNLLFNTYFSEVGQNNLLTYWSGVQKVVNKFDSKSRNALSLQNGIIKQSVNLINTNYTLSFKFMKLIEVATCNVIINGKKITLSGEVDRENTFEYVEDLSLEAFTLEFECDTNDGFLVYEIMLNEGTTASLFTQNANETITNTVNIGAGIEVNASNINTKTRLDADGLRGINTINNKLIFYQTDEGLYSNKLETESIKSGDLLISTRNGHNFLVGL